MKPVSETEKKLVAAGRAADAAEAVLNEARATFHESDASGCRKGYHAADEDWSRKRRVIGEGMMNLFLERVGSLADVEGYQPRSSEGWFVLRFFDAAATVDTRTERQIDADTGHTDGYDREAELDAMKEEESKDIDITQVTESE